VAGYMSRVSLSPHVKRELTGTALLLFSVFLVGALAAGALRSPLAGQGCSAVGGIFGPVGGCLNALLVYVLGSPAAWLWPSCLWCMHSDCSTGLRASVRPVVAGVSPRHGRVAAPRDRARDGRASGHHGDQRIVGRALGLLPGSGIRRRWRVDRVRARRQCVDGGDARVESIAPWSSVRARGSARGRPPPQAWPTSPRCGIPRRRSSRPPSRWHHQPSRCRRSIRRVNSRRPDGRSAEQPSGRAARRRRGRVGWSAAR